MNDSTTTAESSTSKKQKRGRREKKEILTQIPLGKEGGPSKIQVKFNLSWDLESKLPTGVLPASIVYTSEIPPEIILVPRGTDNVVDAAHAKWVEKNLPENEQHRKEEGRLREGRVDSGDLVIQTTDIQLATLRAAFRNRGWALDKVFQYDRDKGRTLVMEFIPVTDMEQVPKLPRNVVEFLRKLSNFASSYLWVYQNLDGTMTINAAGVLVATPKKNQPITTEHIRPPRNALVLRKGVLEVIRVNRKITEREEAESES